MDFKRFHLTLIRPPNKEPHRTTVSLDDYLYEMMAIKLGHDPSSKDGHIAVRQWIEYEIDDWPAFDTSLPMSIQVSYLVTQAIMDATLLKSWKDWKYK